EETERVVVGILVEAVKQALKNDDSRTSQIIDAIRKLSLDIEKDIEKEVEAVTSNISKKLGEIFPGYQVRLQPDVAKVDPDKAIGAGSKLSVAGNGHEFLPVGRHGTGLRRTLFWASLDALVHAGQVKKGKKKL